MDCMDQENQMFTLDQGVQFIPAKRCLVATGGKVIELSENSYRFLLLLLKGETDKQNLINQVWSEQRGSVSESSYYGQLYLLRKAFSLAGLPNTLIKTIPRKGVKYVGYVACGEFLEPAPQRIAIRIEDHDVKNNTSLEGSFQKKQEHGSHNSSLSEIIEPQGLRKAMGEWYHSRSWNIFVSVLSVLAVCWLTTLFVVFFILWKR
ncbi:winged helix-turn-helix domain-containing protein [Serratia sp. NA_112.1]|uniref:winged helix-turn-helix domain-containing protein n=2 Tax=unclassified Serratia (in: enterobacteria) TaxID=2647522 RepID=UPI0040468E14